MPQAVKLTQIDSRGQIVLPKEMRDKLQIDEKTSLILFTVSDKGLLIKRSKNEKISKRD